LELSFTVVQHSRDQALINSILNYLNCGKLYHNAKTSQVQFVVYKFSDLNDKIIPFLAKYPIHGEKHLDYLDFCKVAELMSIKAHLTEDGLIKIKQIKSGMNYGRSKLVSKEEGL
jgi:hypothetical protein